MEAEQRSWRSKAWALSSCVAAGLVARRSRRLREVQLATSSRARVRQRSIVFPPRLASPDCNQLTAQTDRQTFYFQMPTSSTTTSTPPWNPRAAAGRRRRALRRRAAARAALRRGDAGEAAASALGAAEDDAVPGRARGEPVPRRVPRRPPTLTGVAWNVPPVDDDDGDDDDDDGEAARTPAAACRADDELGSRRMGTLC